MHTHPQTAEREGLRTYVFPVELLAERDGRWSASCPTLPGCATFAHSREEALRNIREAVEAYVEDIVAAGEALPASARRFDEIAISVTV